MRKWDQYTPSVRYTLACLALILGAGCGRGSQTKCPEVRPPGADCPRCGEDRSAEPGKQLAMKEWHWQKLPDLEDARELPRLAMWGDGILVVGGGSEMRATALATTEVFDLESQTWRSGPRLRNPRRDAELVTLPDGWVIAIGGSDGPTRTGTRHVEALAPHTDRWLPMQSLLEPRIGHTAVVLRDGRILVVGGQSRPNTYLATAEIFDPAGKDRKWQRVPKMSEARSLHHARLLADGRVIVIGGGTDSSATDSVEIYDPEQNTWKTAASMKEPRWGFASAVLDDGRVIVAGGRIPARKGSTLPDDKLVILRTVEIYDPATDSWTDGPPMNIPRTMGLPNVDLIKLPDGGLMFIAGRSYPAPYHGVASAEVLDPGLGQWSMVRPLVTGRSYQASMLLPSGEILVVGGRGPQFLPLTDVERFKHESGR